MIAERIDNLLSLRARHPNLDILVYVDCASDGTYKVLEAYGTSIRVVNGTCRHGKTFGMNTLVQMTDAEFIVFTDANVTFAEDAISRLVAPFADPAVGCTCGHLRYIDFSHSTSASTGSTYWRLEEWIKSLESRTGSVMGADGSIFAMRRSLHSPPPSYLIDDMFVSLSILCAGYRIVRAADAVATEVAVSKSGEEFERKIRISCQAFNVHRALRSSLSKLAPLDKYKYFSHKVLRWLVAYLLVASGIFAAAFTCWLFGLAWGLAFAAIITCVVWGLFSVDTGLFGAFHQALSAFLATGIGIWRSARGETFQTWEPPHSARLVGSLDRILVEDGL